MPPTRPTSSRFTARFHSGPSDLLLGVVGGWVGGMVGEYIVASYALLPSFFFLLLSLFFFFPKGRRRLPVNELGHVALRHAVAPITPSSASSAAAAGRTAAALGGWWWWSDGTALGFLFLVKWRWVAGVRCRDAKMGEGGRGQEDCCW